MKDSQSRKWQITINNPKEKELDHDRIKQIISDFKSIRYYCMGDELGETYHTHVFLVFNSPVRFSTIKNRFREAHIEMARGTSQENRDYILKAGKWLDDDKHETCISDTFEESGDIPEEHQGERSDLAYLYELIKAGNSNYEIIDMVPDYLFSIDKIERARQMLKAEENKDIFRILHVTYIWGKTGTGKTRGVMEKYGYTNVYRITDYVHPFDSYAGEDVIVFDEFRSQLRIGEMLNYLDGYPLSLPCRYANRQACYSIERQATKNRESRATIPLLPPVKEYLVALNAQQKRNKALLGTAYTDTGYVCAWSDGKAFDPDYVTHHFSRLLKNNGLRHIRFHDLRHPYVKPTTKYVVIKHFNA